MRDINKHLITLMLCLLGIGMTHAQYSVSMVPGITYIDACEHPTGTIYDDGGNLGNYSNQFTGYVVINTPNPSNITLTGSYHTESGCDRIYIYDGELSTGNVLANMLSGNGTVNVTSTTGILTIYFSSDIASNGSGFAFSYTCDGSNSNCTNKPRNLRVTHIGDNSLQLHWTADNPFGQFIVDVNDSVTTVTGSVHTLTGLTPGSTYNLKVSSINDQGEACCTAKRRVRTRCNPIGEEDLPYLYGFNDASGDSYSNTIDNCWSRISKGSGGINPYWPPEGNCCMEFKNRQPDNTLILAMPEYTDSLSKTYVGFYLSNSPPPSGQSGSIEVGVMTDPLDSSTFTLIEMVSNSSTQVQHHYVSLANYTGPGHYVAFRVSGRVEDLFLDNVTLDLIPQCPKVEALKVQDAFPTSVVASWSIASPSISEPTTFEVSAIPYGTTTPYLTDTTSNPYIILSGLEPDTRYYISVRAHCQDSSTGQETTTTALTGESCAGMSSPSGYGFSSLPGVPISTNMGNSACQTIYTASQLRALGVTAGWISKITYTWISVNTNKELTIYLGSTDQDHYESSTMMYTGQTLVCSDLLFQGTSGARTYTFSTPYYWDGVQNIVVTLLTNQPTGTAETSSECYAYSSTFSNDRTLFYGRNDVPLSLSEFAAIGCQSSSDQPDVSFYSCASQHDCIIPTVVINSVGLHEVDLSWSTDTNTRSWNVAYKEALEDTWHNVVTNTTATHCRITHLQSGTPYIIRVTAVCDADQAHTEVKVTMPCRSEGFPYDDLYSDNVICHPGGLNGPIDNGPGSPTSRHTVHSDHLERDPLTNYLLKTVPDGYCTSVRLGNWQVGAQSENIVYNYHVDTNDHDLLLLKYAAVLQNPHHDPDEQPRFVFEITDSAAHDISPCYNADFVANTNLGWNSAPDSVLWKDWTTVGIDLGPLHGQTVRIKLSTYDCELGGHFGYAYFVLDHDNKNITSSSCSSAENTFYAPQGFSYRWYPGSNPSITLSTADTLHVTRQGDYYCTLSYIGAPNDSAHSDCHFTLHAIAGERYPYARFTAEVVDSSSCTRTWVRMANRSITTSDIDRTDSIADGCESYLWEFDDGSTSTEKNPQHAFGPGYHTVTLHAMLAGGNCTDTAQESFYISPRCWYYDTVYRTICDGDTLFMFGTMLTLAGEYQLDSAAASDSTIRRTLFLSTLPRSFDTVAHICCGSYYWPLSTGTYTEAGYYDYALTNAIGCDSVVTLDLTIMPAYDLHFYDTIYEGDTVFFEGAYFSQPGDYTYRFTSRDTCDSIRTLHLMWRYLVQDTLTDSLCEGLEYHFADTILRTAGLYVDTILTSHYPEPDTLRWLTLVIVPLPEVSLSSSAVCDDHPHHILKAHSDMPVYRWSSEPEDPTITYLSDSVITASPELATRYAVYVDYRERRLCPVADSIVLQHIDTVWAYIECQPSSLRGDQRKLTAYARGSASAYRQWYVWYDLAEPFLYDTTANIFLDVPTSVDSLRLTLVARNDFCADSDTVAVPILKSELFFPNIFTPNLSTNNVFRAYHADITGFEIWIYDRRGDLVYHSTDINEGWDGTHDGTPCMQNAYVYKCRYTEVTNPGGHKTRTGTVVLVR